MHDQLRFFGNILTLIQTKKSTQTMVSLTIKSVATEVSSEIGIHLSENIQV